MKDYLKEYHVELTTLGPVHVGNGRQINKKEYARVGWDKVGILDTYKFYDFLKSKRLAGEYEKYLLYNSKEDLTKWLANNRIKYSDIEQCIRYELDCGDAVIDNNGPRDVMECIKDAYGNPYIPGSTLKGMFRTIILANDIVKNSSKYAELKNDFCRNINVSNNRTKYLKKEIEAIEYKSFRTLDRDLEKPLSAVNDYMQGFIVSDSAPLTCDDLILCQKVEIHTDGTKKDLPILRECIKPRVKIHFTITVDSTLCKIDDQKIREMVKNFADIYNQNFLAAYKIKGCIIGEDRVYIGGGSGFVSKTVIYPLLGKNAGIDAAMQIFEKTGVPRQHLHYKDRQYGASPHILKGTRYNGKLYQMGLCKLEIK